MSTDGNNTELGFLVTPESNWCIWDSARFGGKPCWLIPNSIPGVNELMCPFCKKPMCFLMQLYNPVDEIEEAYHRSIYVFVCQQQECLEKGGMKAYRCQLPKRNEFFPETIDDSFVNEYYNSNSTMSPLHYGIHLCGVCGIRATCKCARCNTFYCCKDHQIADWKYHHKENCGKGVSYNLQDAVPRVQFPCYEVDLYPEDEVSEEVIEEVLPVMPAGDGGGEITEKDLRDAMGGRMEDDPIRLKFNKRIGQAKTQVLRVCRWRNEAILWASSSTRLEEEKIPRCSCGKERKFEFQIMPQLIYLLGQEENQHTYPEIDFGSLVVFTCCNSCSSCGSCGSCGDIHESSRHPIQPYQEEYIYFHSHYSKKDIEDMKKQLSKMYEE